MGNNKPKQLKVLLLQRGLTSDYTFNKIYGEPMKQALGANLLSFNQAQLYYPNNVKKVPAADKRQWLEHVKDKLDEMDIIMCSDGDYFKVLAGTSKAEGTVGVLYDSKYTSAKILYVPSVAACNFHPDKNLEKLAISIKTISDFGLNQYTEAGTGIIHSYEHPMTVESIKKVLEKLHQYPALVLDIEAKALRFSEAGIYTIAFAWDKNNYVAFPVDAIENQSKEVRELLKQFIISYKGKFIIHKANYDVTVLNYVLFQNEDIHNIKGQVEGLNTFFGSDNQRIEDTVIIAYLAINSCAGNILGLKELASEFAGDWAVDVKDVTKVPLEKLLTYNGIDCLCTWFVYNKYYPIMVTDEQEDLYKSFMLLTLKNNIRCQLNGLPINDDAVSKLSDELSNESLQLTTKLNSFKEIKEAEWLIAEEATRKRNAKLKTKVTSVEENLQDFNYSSTKQLQVLLYNVMALPVIETTKGKEPACGKDVIRTLVNHTENQTYKDILNCLADLADISKIESAFIPAFKNPVRQKGISRLCGFLNFNTLTRA